jgi:hypothetical protein
MKFNLLGFNFPREETEKYKHCVIHPGNRLIQSQEDPEELYCPMCETPYSEETTSEERFMPKFGSQSSKSQIITAK